MKNLRRKTVLALIIVFLVWAYTKRFGYLDTFPRVQQVSISADGNWRFSVYQRKLEWLNPLADSEIVFKIEDLEGGRTHEQRIWRSGWSRGFKRDTNYAVRFEKDVIIVNGFWVADKSDLEFEMCPLLSCLDPVETGDK